jgi:Xaa-Pro aminopeptidase
VSRQEPLYNEAELERVVDDLGADAIVARSGRNVAYLSGMRFPGTLGRLQDFTYSPRAVLVVWPREGSPTLFVSEIATDLARRLSWIDDLRSYTEYTESPYERAAEHLNEIGLGDGKIGIERREFGVTHWEQFRETVPDAELIDCTDALESVRNVKTPAERELLDSSVEIQDAAHRDVFESARPGDTEKELHTRMIESLLSRGAERAHGMMQASSNPVTYGGEGETELTEGDLLRTDYVSYQDGYAANLSRMAVVGEPDPEQAETYRAVRDVHRKTADEMLRPGVEAQEVYDFVGRELTDRGIEDVAGLVGHSTGVWWHQEEPMLVPGERWELREDMVVCLETIANGFWHLQDQFALTDGEPTLMSDGFDTDRLYVIE